MVAISKNNPRRVTFVVTGLLLVRALVIAAPGTPIIVPFDPDGVQRATVILDSYSYEPKYLIVQAGKPVELILKSATILTPHNFVIHEPAAARMIERDVGSGKSETVRFTPTQPGRFPFYCDKKLLF